MGFALAEEEGRHYETDSDGGSETIVSERAIRPPPGGNDRGPAGLVGALREVSHDREGMVPFDRRGEVYPKGKQTE
ncbi:MAG: hypothetical protein GF346_03465 [Candidatus Eisenbacteria bacterium]|nr:hypothetical protein [Candidatus Latescibacterota bacterium]MBD3301481.1 hypothetical protein [Candidatus Eisenbacteria bacterium]